MRADLRVVLQTMPFSHWSRGFVFKPDANNNRVLRNGGGTFTRFIAGSTKSHAQSMNFSLIPTTVHICVHFFSNVTNSKDNINGTDVLATRFSLVEHLLISPRFLEAAEYKRGFIIKEAVYRNTVCLSNISARLTDADPTRCYSRITAIHHAAIFFCR